MTHRLTLIDNEIIKIEEASFLAKTIYFNQMVEERSRLHEGQDFSRQRLILAFHFYALGNYKRAQTLIRAISPSYWQRRIFDDLEASLLSRQKADEYARTKQENLMKKHMIEGRFFLSVLLLLPYLRQDEYLRTIPEVQFFLRELEKRQGSKTFTLDLAPFIGLL